MEDWESSLQQAIAANPQMFGQGGGGATPAGSPNWDAINSMVQQGYKANPDGTITAPDGSIRSGSTGGDPSGIYKAPAKPTDQTSATASANADAVVKDALDQFGLGSLATWAMDLVKQGYDTGYIMHELRQRPEFDQRFPAIKMREKAGLPPISPAQYVQNERDYDRVTHAAGIDGFFDRSTMYTKWISGDVSPSEIGQRAQNAYQAALGEPLDVRAELHRMYGTDAAGVATAYFLDPKNTLGEAQRRLTAGEIGGGSSRSGYGLITRDEAELLAAQGVSGQQAQQGFGKLAGESQLFNPLVGQNGEQTIGREQQFAAQFSDNAQAQKAIESQAQARVAQFSGSRGSLGKTGVSGLGDSTN